MKDLSRRVFNVIWDYGPIIEDEIYRFLVSEDSSVTRAEVRQALRGLFEARLIGTSDEAGGYDI